MSSLESVGFAENPEPRCACVLLLDTSDSMGGPPIAALNEGLTAFRNDIRGDTLAQQRVEIAIITFGGAVEVVQDFVTAGSFEPPTVAAGGDTPMGAAILDAVDLVERRKGEYKNNGIQYYRPWVFMITDGEPTDNWQFAATRVHQAEGANGLAFFAVGVQNANMEILSQISVRTPLKLQGLKFAEMFVWLSRSQQRVSASKVGDQTSLPEVKGWTSV